MRASCVSVCWLLLRSMDLWSLTCHVPEPALTGLRHYLSWRQEWRADSPSIGCCTFDVVHYKEMWHFHGVGSFVLLMPESSVSTNFDEVFWTDHSDWLQMLAGILNPALQSKADGVRLLKLEGKVSTCRLDRAEIPRWRPSSGSDFQRGTEQVVAHLRSRSLMVGLRLLRVEVREFNVKDPEVLGFAVAEANKSGTRRRIPFRGRFSNRQDAGTNEFFASRFDHPADLSVVEKALSAGRTVHISGSGAVVREQRRR